MAETKELYGEIVKKQVLEGEIQGRRSLEGTITIPKVIGGEYIQAYDGEYVIKPEVDAQTLATAGKKMLQDVTVKAIPYYEVSNDANGDTVIIGGAYGEE